MAAENELRKKSLRPATNTMIIIEYFSIGPQDFLSRRLSFFAGIEPAHFAVRAIRRLLPDCSTIFTFLSKGFEGIRRDLLMIFD